MYIINAMATNDNIKLEEYKTRWFYIHYSQGAIRTDGPWWDDDINKAIVFRTQEKAKDFFDRKLKGHLKEIYASGFIVDMETIAIRKIHFEEVLKLTDDH